eukprot:2788324-Prymnesium_polylepis.1
MSDHKSDMPYAPVRAGPLGSWPPHDSLSPEACPLLVRLIPARALDGGASAPLPASQRAAERRL